MSERNPVVCRICMIQIMRTLYKRHFWFPLVREPLVWGMRILALANGIKPADHAAANPECRGCLRYVKAELEARSGTFRFLNKFLGPWFQRVRDPRMFPEDVGSAKERARLMMEEPGRRESAGKQPAAERPGGEQPGGE
ncbi:MAG: nitroreductase [Deltaproteobacteria bacterium]|nr:nitroreductase [Deltaproteobacteria bacterium]